MKTHHFSSRRSTAHPAVSNRAAPAHLKPLSVGASNQELLQKKSQMEPEQDALEQGSDRVADDPVMQLPNPTPPPPPVTQRKTDQPEEVPEEEPLQRQALPESEVDVEDTLQRMPGPGSEDDEETGSEPLQAKKNEPFQRAHSNQSSVIQGRFHSHSAPGLSPVHPGGTQNRNSIPGPLKHGLETLSGMNLSGIRVHRNSEKPAQVNALAYTQGKDIYIGPGQEKHLPHEGWHAVQQMQGRVRPTFPAGGTPVNDDERLEREADMMGEKALKQSMNSPREPRVPSEPLRAPGKESKGVTPHPGPAAIQRVLGPPYPFQGIVTTRWTAALRDRASRNGNLIAGLPRNTRVTAIGNTGNWLEVRTTIDGEVQTGFISQELVGNIPAAGFAPAVSAGGRVEVTDFGTYNVYPNNHQGALQPNELYEAEFQRLEDAWTAVGDNSGGMQTHGAAADLADFRDMIGRGMANSQTFRNLIVEITEDAANPVTIHVGRNNAYWVDAFATNRVDLTDTEFFDAAPRPGHEWASTQDELTIHWLAERRHAAVHGGGFGPAHAEPLSAGGVQEQYRADIGQPGRIVSQVRDGPAGGLHAGVYTDDSGNIMRIRRDGSGGDPVPYEIRYEPAGGGAVDTRRNNIVVSVTSNNASAEDVFLKLSTAAHDVTSPVNAVSSASALNFTTPLGGLVPTRGAVDVELYWKGRWILPDTLIGTLNWAHPFTPGTTVVSASGVDYTINAQLVMEP